ncbi:site-specific DNA-methyltransferase [Ancrocorticia populi]|uniref:Site-specific DNA-methyltransferase n=2 Tax=Ancrocorticia populi TaxID=2175228 RepID=A0A2V1KCD0_9ACTO|nr:site-specific DNA-methyltransferase [Ancrocorticia populi]
MQEQQSFEFDVRPPIKGYPQLQWTGKRPYRGTVYYPAQLRERYGTETDGWINKLFWGDNLQVMSHLLHEYRGQVDLIYIDPPFDSKADYKKKIKLKDSTVANDSSSFEDKQYGDIWTNDQYLQFMYERLTLCRELLSDTGSIYLHCDWHKSHHLRMLMDEVFGPKLFQNEIVWQYSGWNRKNSSYFNRRHDTILFYTKTNSPYFEPFKLAWSSPEEYAKARKQKVLIEEESGRKYVLSDGGAGKRVKRYLDEAIADGRHIDDVWTIDKLNNSDKEGLAYPTQKPERLLERIVSSSCSPEGIVFDCFMGSGTTQAVAMKLGRRFIGADINLGAIQTTTKRLLSVATSLGEQQESLDVDGSDPDTFYTGFEVYNVNNYDLFRNPVQARDLLMEALEIQPYEQSNLWDGTLDGRMVKIMPVNRIATKADLKVITDNLPYKTYEKRKADNPSQPVEQVTLVCMGHEPDLKASLESELSEYKVDVAVVDILKDKKELEFKREAEAEVVLEGNRLVIRSFYPLNLMQKLSLQREYIEDWRQLVESIVIDWNYDGVVMEPSVTDIPDKKTFVKGYYEVPDTAGTIKVKITDLLSESLEVEVQA